MSTRRHRSIGSDTLARKASRRSNGQKSPDYQVPYVDMAYDYVFDSAGDPRGYMVGTYGKRGSDYGYTWQGHHAGCDHGLEASTSKAVAEDRLRRHLKKCKVGA